MRVAHLEFGRHLYGGARQVLYLTEGLAKAGVDNLLYCARNSAIASAAHGTSARVVELAVRGDADVALPWRVAQQLREDRVDLVHVHSRRGADTYGGWAARLAQRPAVLTRRVDNPESPWLARIKYARFAAVIGISQEIVRMLNAHGLVDVAWIPSAVDTQRFTPEEAPAGRARLSQLFGIDPEAPVVGMIAQFIPRKGHLRALDIVAATRRQVANMRLILFGQGPMEAEVADRARALGLEDAVVFAGLRTDIHQLLAGLDVVLHPAEREGLGVALLESQSSGVPVIATKAGGMVDAVQHDLTGLLLPLADIDRWAAELTGLIADPVRRRAMGEAGRVLMIENFSIAAMVKRNMAVYERVMGHGGS